MRHEIDWIELIAAVVLLGIGFVGVAIDKPAGAFLGAFFGAQHLGKVSRRPR